MPEGNTAKKLDAPTGGMSAETFKHLRDLIYEQTGIHFQENKKYLLESRLAPRLKECRCRTYEDYLNFLRFDTYRDREFTGLYTVITTNETYFFRDEAQMETFMRVIVPAVMKANDATRQVRIWSAACSTGDEPYTIAMLLRDYAPLANWSIEILATDISESVLEVGRRGMYSSHSLRKVPAAMLATKAGFEWLHVPYKGSPPLLQDLMASRVDAAFTGFSNALPHHQAGKVRIIGVGAATRIKSIPNAPTFKELGLQEIGAEYIIMLSAPGGTPREVLNLLANTARAVVQDKDVREGSFEPSGLEPIGSTATEAASYITADRPQQRERIRVSGAKLD